MPNSHERKSKEESKGSSELCNERGEWVEKYFFLGPRPVWGAPKYDPSWGWFAVDFWHHFSVGRCKSVFVIGTWLLTASYFKYLERFRIHELSVNLLKFLKLFFRFTIVEILRTPFVPRKPAAHFLWEFLFCAGRVAKDTHLLPSGESESFWRSQKKLGIMISSW